MNNSVVKAGLYLIQLLSFYLFNKKVMLEDITAGVRGWAAVFEYT